MPNDIERLIGFSPLITSPKGGTAYVVVAIPVATAFAAFKRLMVRQLVGLGPILFTLAVRGEPVEPQLPFDKLRANGWKSLSEQHWD